MFPGEVLRSAMLDVVFKKHLWIGDFVAVILATVPLVLWAGSFAHLPSKVFTQTHVYIPTEMTLVVRACLCGILRGILKRTQQNKRPIVKQNVDNHP
jgi:hypothetical protein